MTAARAPDRPANIAHEELASVGQRMLWLIDHYRGGSGALNYPLLLKLSGPADLAAIQAALDRLVIRHETLRTTFARRRGLLTQFVHQPEPVILTTAGVGPGHADGLRQCIRDEITTSIDPRVSPLRVTLWSLSESEHVLCINAHHMVTDAWSCRILVEEFLHLLAGAPELPRTGWQYRHFVQWQHRKTTAERMQSDRDYWQQRLQGAEAPALQRCGSGSPPPSGLPSSKTIQVNFDRRAGDRLRQLARAEQTTPFTVLLSIYYFLIYQESGLADVSIASPFANRTRPEVMRTIGFFANLLVLRTRLQPGSTFLDLLRRSKLTVSEALAHQSFPYVLPSADARAASAGRVEDIIFQMLPELPAPITLGELEIEVLPPMVESRFDLELSVLPYRDGFRALLQYAPHRITDALARRLATGCASMVDRLASPADVIL